MTSLNKNKVKIKSQDVEVFYNKFQALYEINMDVEENRVTALIGPSGCGKSTFLRTLNRLNELIPGTEVKGQVFLDGQPIYSRDVDVVAFFIQIVGN
jgi:phosphate transport system ATP-binding protein